MTEESHPPIRFGVIGINHPHIYSQVNLLQRARAQLVSVYAAERDLLAQFTASYPQAEVVQTAEAILEDDALHLVVSAAIPSERAGIGIAAMRHGRDYMSDKPGFTTLEQLEEARRVQAETGRIYSICYSERFGNRVTVKAGELVIAGAIGRVVHTMGLGPHSVGDIQRPEWFYQRQRYGGILADIASHQADQFLFVTGSNAAEVVASQVANWAHPERPEFEDFGEMMVRGNGATGYIRVDWLTPRGLGTWGDARLIILGTDGYIELRKNIDIAGRPGDNHLFLVNHQGTHYIDCRDVALPYGPRLVQDIIRRTEMAMSQEHCFLASELVLKAQATARRLGHLADREVVKSG